MTLFAPAKNISVASTLNATSYRDPRRWGWYDGTRNYPASSGTSWSAPIVAGVIARILEANPTFTADQVYTKLMEHAIVGRMIDDAAHPLNPPQVTGTPNVMLNLADVSIQTQPADAYASSASPASLTVVATAVGTATYQWYQVNAGFELTQKRGATSSTAIVGATSSTLSNLNPSTATGYWVRVKSACAQTESDIAVVTPQPPISAPQNVVATAAGTTVTIQWDAVTNATGYQVERKVNGQNWSDAVTVTSASQFSATDVPPAGKNAVLYRVRATLGTAKSDPSYNDVAYVKTFAGDPILTGVPYTLISALHLVEMRQAVNDLLAAVDLLPVYTGAALDVVEVKKLRIDDADFSTLLANLNAARTHGSIGLGAISFLNAPAQNGAIDDTQMAKLRSGVK